MRSSASSSEGFSLGRGKVQILAGKVLEKPIELIVNEAKSEVAVGKAACAHMLLRIGDAAPAACFIHLSLAAQSQLFCLVLLDAKSVEKKVEVRCSLREGARLHVFPLLLRGSVACDIRSTVTGANATSTIDGVFYGADNDRIALSVRNAFEARDGGGEITVRGIAAGKAHVHQYGQIDIGEKGAGTNTYLTQNVLMLDASANVESVPALEIRTNDVRASHASTVTNVSAEDIFYLASRGIPAAEGRRLIVRGFAEQLLERIPPSLQPLAKEELSKALST